MWRQLDRHLARERDDARLAGVVVRRGRGADPGSAARHDRPAAGEGGLHWRSLSAGRGSRAGRTTRAIRAPGMTRAGTVSHMTIDTGHHRAAPPLSTSVVEAVGGTPLL